MSSYSVLQSDQDRAVQSAVFKQGLPASTALSRRFSDWLNSRSHLLTRIPYAAKPSEPVFRLMSAFLAVSLRCLSAPSARGQSDASVPHELHTRNREADVVHLWKATETSDQSWSECLRLSWIERICPERHLALPIVPMAFPFQWSLLPAKHGLGYPSRETR